MEFIFGELLLPRLSPEYLGTRGTTLQQLLHWRLLVTSMTSSLCFYFIPLPSPLSFPLKFYSVFTLGIIFYPAFLCVWIGMERVGRYVSLSPLYHMLPELEVHAWHFTITLNFQQLNFIIVELPLWTWHKWLIQTFLRFHVRKSICISTEYRDCCRLMPPPLLLSHHCRHLQWNMGNRLERSKWGSGSPIFKPPVPYSKVRVCERPRQKGPGWANWLFHVGPH